MARTVRPDKRAGFVRVLLHHYPQLTPRVAPDEAWGDATALFAWAPHAINAALLARAREIEQRRRLSWRDSMVVGAAQLQECTLLLTEDLQDGDLFGGVMIRSPFTPGVREPAATCAAVPAATSRHRPRGRPGKTLAASAARR